MNWTEDQRDAYMAARHRGREAVSPEIPDPGPEARLQSRCERYCREQGWPCFHDRSKKKNKPGFPDLFVFLPGGTMALIELKAAGGRLRTEQQALRRQMMYLGHTVHVVRSYKRFLDVLMKDSRHSDVLPQLHKQNENGFDAQY